MPSLIIRALCVVLVGLVGCSHATGLQSAGPPDECAKPTTLTEAAACLDLPAVRHAIEIDHADPNQRDADGVPSIAIGLLTRSVYWHKADERAVDVARYLLAHGADPNARFSHGGHQGITALHLAAYDGDVRLARLLVDSGAEVNAARDDGSTPLHAAASCDFRLSCDDCGTSGARPTLELLVAHGGDLRKKTSAGRDVLSTVPTPCADHPELCEPERLASANWYSGTCKQTYAWITRTLAALPAR